MSKIKFNLFGFLKHNGKSIDQDVNELSSKISSRFPIPIPRRKEFKNIEILLKMAEDFDNAGENDLAKSTLKDVVNYINKKLLPEKQNDNAKNEYDGGVNSVWEIQIQCDKRHAICFDEVE